MKRAEESFICDSIHLSEYGSPGLSSLTYINKRRGLWHVAQLESHAIKMPHIPDLTWFLLIYSQWGL